ncbi:MAG: class I SAM-dependent methyltransferase [Legionellales bacterium]|nr:class I SAM-dependent methyltransferase [Legionellales bacterium]
MNSSSHSSAKSNHYNKEAEYYDAFNEKNSRLINKVIERVFAKYKVKKILDLTCGTGSQVFWLAKYGYDVTGYDINSKMLEIARDKAKQRKLNLKFIKGDMRKTKAGTFDAVITIFNSVGHLTKIDFEKSIRNIYANLNAGGLYIFDIFNLSYLIKGKNITKLTIDWQEIIDDSKIREIQYSTINQDGVLASYTIKHLQEGLKKPKIATNVQTLQVYTSKELKDILQRNGFKVLHQCDIDGTKLSQTRTERILTVARVD